MSDLIRFLQEALDTERQVGEFYRRSAESVQSPHLKAVLLALADDEEEHERIIGLYYDALVKSQGWPKELDQDAQTQIAPLAIALQDAISNIASHASYLSLYQQAYELEIRGRDIYIERAKNAEDEHGKRFFSFLASLESAHVLAFDTLIQSIRRIMPSKNDQT